MTNRERYRKAANLVAPSREMNLMAYVEEQTMKKTNRRPMRRVMLVCACVILVLALGVGAYAADVGGVRKSVGIWLHGDMTEVTIEQVAEGQFAVIYPDGSKRMTGGMSGGMNGMRGLTLDEITEYLRSSVEAEQDEDGRIWLYLRDHKIEITDQIAQRGVAQVKVKDGLLPDYITLIWEGDGGYSVSTGHYGYPSPESLRSSTR